MNPNEQLVRSLLAVCPLPVEEHQVTEVRGDKPTPPGPGTPAGGTTGSGGAEEGQGLALFPLGMEAQW